MTDHHDQPQPKRPTFATPMRTCANVKCGRKFDPQGKPWLTCSFRCKQAYDTQLAAIEAADSGEKERPF